MAYQSASKPQISLFKGSNGTFKIWFRVDDEDLLPTAIQEFEIMLQIAKEKMRQLTPRSSRPLKQREETVEGSQKEFRKIRTSPSNNDRIRIYRESGTGSQLAERFNVSLSTVSRIKNGVVRNGRWLPS